MSNSKWEPATGKLKGRTKEVRQMIEVLRKQMNADRRKLVELNEELLVLKRGGAK